MKLLKSYSKLLCLVQLFSVLFFVLPVVAANQTSSVLLDEKQWTGDLDQLKEKGAIRILVPVSNPDFFIDGFKKYGLTPVKIAAFQKFLNEEIITDTFIRTIMIPTSRATVLNRLVAGYGDIAVANLTITEERLKSVDFATPMQTGVKEIIVGAPGSPVLKSLNDLSGKTVFTRSFTSYHEHLLRLNRKFESEGMATVKIELVTKELEDDNLLAMVNEGLIPFIVIDHRKMEMWQEIFSKVVSYPNLAIDRNGKISWALRKNSPQLLKVLSRFSLEHQNAPVDMAAIRQSTAKEVVQFRNLEEGNVKKFVELYPLVEKIGKEFDLPPLVLAALAFERSGIDNSKIGKNGQLGIMQLAPFIAREVGLTDTDYEGLELHIATTAKYLSYLEQEKFKDLSGNFEERWLFAIAAYLNGPEKINQMRWVTSKMGKDGNKWFNEVDVTVSRLIGRKTVRAVRAIGLYYVVYKMAIESGAIVVPEKTE